MNRLISRLGTRSFTSRTKLSQIDGLEIVGGVILSMPIMGVLGGLGGAFCAGMKDEDPFVKGIGGMAYGFFYPVVLFHQAGHLVRKISERKSTS